MPGPDARRATWVSRRKYLAGLGTGLVAGLAGCSLSSTGITTETFGADTDGSWNRHVKFTPADEGVSHFGNAVDLAPDGTTALVSATYHDTDDGLPPGPAYVLERTDGDWGVAATLLPEDGAMEMNFGGKGESVALSADTTTAIVGADRADRPNGAESGVAYLFERTDDTWNRQSRLVPDDGDRKDFFGKSVALSADGTLALIGAWGTDTPNPGGGGSAYVFERADGGWTQQAKLVPAEGTGGAFGSSVTLAADGTRALIGTPADDEPNGQTSGSAYVFTAVEDGWQQRAKLAAADGGPGDYFGGSVTLAGDTALVGAPEADEAHGEAAGSAYVFERADGTWTQQAKLVADDGDGTDLFGVATALSEDGSTALCGARVDEDPNGDLAGSAYVFAAAADGWGQQAKLVAADGESHDVFGRSVAMAGDGRTAAIGTMRAGAYVFGDGAGGS